MPLYMVTLEGEFAVVADDMKKAQTVALRNYREEDIGPDDFRITSPVGREVPNGWDLDFVPHGEPGYRSLREVYDDVGDDSRKDNEDV